mgnify:CR=1 FL=1
MKENYLSKIYDVCSMTDYQEESIISRTLIDKKIGTVTFFAFDKGQSLSTHTAPFDAMVQVIDGEVKITIENDIYNLKTGQMIVMPAGKPHSVNAKTKFKMILIMIKE